MIARVIGLIVVLAAVTTLAGLLIFGLMPDGAGTPARPPATTPGPCPTGGARCR